MSDVLLLSELASRLADTLPDGQAEQSVKTLLESLSEALASGERVESGRRRVPRFKPGKEMRERTDQARSLGPGSTPLRCDNKPDRTHKA